jgi:X-Pro dipeptidyl-peptidase
MPVPFASFPVPGAEPVLVRPARGGTAVAALSANAATGVDTLVDDVSMSGSAAAGAAESRHRLLYATKPLGDTVRISGTARVTLRVASSKPAANLSVWLVTLPYDSAMVGSQGHAGVITRGWADIQNHASLKRGGNYDSKKPGRPLQPGRFYDVTFDLEPDHQVIPPGKQIALLIMSSDAEFTLWPQPGTRLMVDLARSSISIPIVGGAPALAKAGGAACLGERCG